MVAHRDASAQPIEHSPMCASRNWDDGDACDCGAVPEAGLEMARLIALVILRTEELHEAELEESSLSIRHFEGAQRSSGARHALADARELLDGAIERAAGVLP